MQLTVSSLRRWLTFGVLFAALFASFRPLIDALTDGDPHSHALVTVEDDAHGAPDRVPEGDDLRGPLPSIAPAALALGATFVGLVSFGSTRCERPPAETVVAPEPHPPRA